MHIQSFLVQKSLLGDHLSLHSTFEIESEYQKLTCFQTRSNVLNFCDTTQVKKSNTFRAYTLQNLNIIGNLFVNGGLS